MDSITHLALGAALGEATLGKKIGARAFVWGAFANTVPDLDVLANFFTSPINALAFHRGFMHSIVFGILAAAGLGGAVEWLYRSGLYRRRRYKWAVFSAVLAFYALLMLGIRWIFGDAVNSWGWLAAAILGGLGLAWFIWAKYVSKPLEDVSVSRKEWILFFFITVFSHPVLDCFNVYGTQLFQPFNDHRVSFDNISVADPAFSIWLLLGILITSFLSKTSKARRIVNWTGIGISMAYMCFTFYHKAVFNQIFTKSLATEKIDYQRCMSGPSILTNSLWLGVAEGDESFYHGYYTFFSEDKRVRKFSVIPKNHELLKAYENDRVVKILKWFSKGYYNVIVRRDGRLQFNDLRYGSFEEGFKDENDYVFKFILEKKDGKLDAEQSREGRKINGEAFGKYWDRVLAKD